MANKPQPPLLEADLLIASSRSSVDPAARQRIRALAGRGPDWNLLIQLSMEHGTRPLVFLSLSAACADLVPPEVLRSLRKHYCAVVLQNARLAAALVEIVGALQAKAIAILPFKGPALAALAYGDAGLRESGDLDILVRKRDIGAAIQELAERRFVLLNDPEPGTQPGERRYNLLVREREGVRVDLQWMIAATHFSFSLEQNALWERTLAVKLAETEVPGLSAEATLLVLCIHGSKHLWSELKWTCDIAELLSRHPGLDWQWILRVSSKIRCRRMLQIGLLLARDMFGAAIDGTILKRVGKKRGVELLAARLLGQLRSGERPHTTDIVSAADYFVLLDGPRDRMRLLLHIGLLIEPSDQRSIQRLPLSFRTFYHALVPFRRVGKRLKMPGLKTALWRWLIGGN